MDSDDDTPRVDLPPGVVAYNGVITPYSSGIRPVTLNGEFVTLNGRPVVLTDPTAGPVETGVVLTSRDGTILTSRDGTPLIGRTAPIADPDLPDLPPGQAYLVDDDGTLLIDDDGAFLVDGASEDQRIQPTAELTEDYTKTSLGRRDSSPPGEVFITDESGKAIVDELGRRLVVDTPANPSSAPNFSNFRFAEIIRDTSSTQSAETIKLVGELQSRLQLLEASLEEYRGNLPQRDHNHPPELVEPDPLSTNELNVIINVTINLKSEIQQPQPDPGKLEVGASMLRAIAGNILSWIGRKTDGGIDGILKWGGPAAAVWMIAHPEKVHAALIAVAETASALAQHLSW